MALRGKGHDPLEIKFIDESLICVPVNAYSIEGLVARKSKWGTGVFWDGARTLPRGVNITVYPGRYSPLTLSQVAQSESVYMLSLQHYDGPARRAPNKRYYCDAADVDSTDYGMGHLINSAGPSNWIYSDRFANCIYFEHTTGDGEVPLPIPGQPKTHRVLLQTLTEVCVGDEILTDYHTMFMEQGCCCFSCVNESRLEIM